MKTQRAAGQRPALPKRQSKARCAAGRPTRPRRQNEKRGGSERTRPFPVVPAAGRQLHGGKIRLAAGQRPALPKQQSKARCAAGRPTRPRRRNEKRDGSERIRPFPVVPAAGRQLRDEDPTGSRPAAGSTETAVKGQMCGWQASACRPRAGNYAMKTQRAAGQRPALPKQQSKARCAAGRPARPRRQMKKGAGPRGSVPFW